MSINSSMSSEAWVEVKDLTIHLTFFCSKGWECSRDQPVEGSRVLGVMKHEQGLKSVLHTMDQDPVSAS